MKDKKAWNEYMRQWREQNPEKQKAIERRQRATMKAQGITGHENRDAASVQRYRDKQTEKYRNDPQYRAKIRASNGGRYHRIAPEEYVRRRTLQCEICGIYKVDVRVGCGMHIDHDHLTGALRGTLCDRCNRGIGMFDDSPDKLLKAAKYVRRYAIIVQALEA